MPKLASLLLCLALCLTASTAPAQKDAYPARVVHIIIGSEAGGPVDAMARDVARILTDGLGGQVIVESKLGAGATLAADYVAKAAPDGYTILFASPASVSIGPLLNPNVKYNSIRDFAPVSNIGTSYFLLTVTPTLPVKNLKEFVAWGKSNPGKLSFGSVGSGSVTQLGAVLLNSVTGIKAEHIPYKGSQQMIADLLSGRIHYTISPEVLIGPQIRANKVRPIGSTGPRRIASFPDLPTIAESGFAGFEISSWYGALAPAATPRDIVTKLSNLIAKGLKDPEVSERMRRQGLEVLGTTPEEFARTIREESPIYAKLIKESGAVAD